jgi:sulfur carrier protein
MNVKVNGEERVVGEENISVSRLLELSNVDMPDMVSVQLNGGFVEREAFARTNVAEGDEVDFLYFMGGGR